MRIVAQRPRTMAQEEQLGFEMPGLEKPVGTEAVRIELNALIATARAARDAPPWDGETHWRHRAAFAERAKALPPEEAEFLRRQFVFELDRIELMLAA